MSGDRTMDDWVDSIHFAGGPGEPLSDNEDPDDEELAETPPDVVKILGFDPKGADYSTD